MPTLKDAAADGAVASHRSLVRSRVMLQETATVIGLITNSIKILKSLSDDTTALQRQYALIVTSLEVQTLTLQRIEKKLDDHVLRVAFKSGIYLEDALCSASDHAREISLEKAYEGFTELLSLDPKLVTAGISVTVSNIKLIGLGYAGRFIYYCILGSYRDCLRQVYQCTEKLPETGLAVFGDSFFSKQYRALLDSLDERISRITSQLKTDVLPLVEGIPINQMLPLLEMNRESLLEEAQKECRFLLDFLNKQSASS